MLLTFIRSARGAISRERGEQTSICKTCINIVVYGISEHSHVCTTHPEMMQKRAPGLTHTHVLSMLPNYNVVCSLQNESSNTKKTENKKSNTIQMEDNNSIPSTEGGRTRVTYFADKGASACPRFIKR